MDAIELQSEADQASFRNHREYQRLCAALDLPGKMTLPVWAGCELQAQEDMLQQLRVALEQRDHLLARYEAQHGAVW